METTSGTQSTGSRRWLWPGAAGLLVLASGVWVAVRPDASPPRKAGPPVEDTAEQPIRPKSPESVARADPERPPPKRAAPPANAAPPPAVAPPDDTEPPVSDPTEHLPSDPFEPQGGEDPAIRTLVEMGDIRLGVVRDAQVRDEQGLKNILVQIGKDMEKSDEQLGSDAPPELQQLLDGYREELGQYMTGEVEIRGPSWMIGTEVGPPRPLGEGWRPRPY